MAEEKKTTRMQKAGKVAKGGLVLAGLGLATVFQPELGLVTVPAMLGVLGFGMGKKKDQK